MESAWRRLFMCPGQIRDALDAAEGDPRRRCRCGAARRASKARTPRVYEAIGNVPAALRREISAAHRSCGGNRIPEPARCRLFCVQSRKRAALDAEGDPRLSVPMRCRQEST
nr:hypothetical protein [Bacillus velezensis]